MNSNPTVKDNSAACPEKDCAKITTNNLLEDNTPRCLQASPARGSAELAESARKPATCREEICKLVLNALIELSRVLPVPDSPKDVEFFLLDTVEHAPHFDMVRESCAAVGVPVSLEVIRENRPIKDFIMSIIRCVAVARKNKHKLFFLCITHPIYSDGPLLKDLIGRIQRECKNVRILSTAAKLPPEPLNKDVVTYITNDEAGSERLSGSFILPEPDAKNYSLNFLLGVAMIKLACCGDETLIDTACTAWDRKEPL